MALAFVDSITRSRICLISERSKGGFEKHLEEYVSRVAGCGWRGWGVARASAEMWMSRGCFAAERQGKESLPPYAWERHPNLS